MSIEVRQAPNGFAGEILGADPECEEDFEAVHQAFLDHGVITIRNLPLSPEAQLAFSRRFGPLMGRRPSTPDKVLMPGQPEIVILSNRKENGENVGITDAGRYWHSDLCFEEEPNLGTIVHAIEVPPEGGDTLFADLGQAYATLPDDLKSRIEGKRAAHTFRKHYLEVMAEGSPRPPLTEEQFAALKETYHPIARTHPDTGRKTLFINPGHTTHVEGMDEAESQGLLDALFEHCLQPQFIYRHKWWVGDTVIWDNRRVMHNAEPYDMGRYTRHMHRTCIHGDRPF
ncbi:MAG: TauD/TfdA family dioxygenase [Alphaproteobacteria bacterium]|nr:TauD/TfdA family dioxygenase [Alphaproteobacteria bacterium]